MKEKILVWRAELLEELEKEVTKEYLFNATLNTKLLSNQLHKWKGSCSILGLTDLADVLKNFECHLAVHKNLGEAQGTFDQWSRILLKHQSK